MPVATVIAVLQALSPLVGEVPEIVAGISAMVDSLKSGNPPTPEQQAAIDQLLEKTHAQLQA